MDNSETEIHVPGRINSSPQRHVYFFNVIMTDAHVNQILLSDSDEIKMYDFEYEIDPESHVFNTI